MTARIFKNPHLINQPTTSADGFPPADLQAFHRALPHYAPTPLVSLPSLASTLQISHLLLKNESTRFSLPAFKILGASWATAKAISQALNVPILPREDPTSPLQHLGTAAQAAQITLYAATDGNHGRAVARMSSYLGIPARIYVPKTIDNFTISKIEGEGAVVQVWDGDYDATVVATKAAALNHSQAGSPGRGLLISDTALEANDEIPGWQSEGYQTMFDEIEEQILKITDKPVTHILTPVGVGSLCQAVCTYFSLGRNPSQPRPSIITVEPTTAACFKASLEAGKMVSIKTGYTICTGLCCGTVSANTWPVMKSHVSMAMAVDDQEVEHAMRALAQEGVRAGPCGAATTAAVQILPDLGSEAVVVLLCTEGEREYSMKDPDSE